MNHAWIGTTFLSDALNIFYYTMNFFIKGSRQTGKVSFLTVLIVQTKDVLNKGDKKYLFFIFLFYSVYCNSFALFI